MEPYHAHFTDPRAADEDWIRFAGARGWYVLTRDYRIRYTPALLKTVLDCHIGMFVLRGNRTHPELAAVVLDARAKLMRHIAKTERPFIARLYRASSGKATLVPIPLSGEPHEPPRPTGTGRRPK